MKRVTMDIKTMENLLSVLQREKIDVPAYCGGSGTCGKCKVRFVDHPSKITVYDREVFSQKELNQGWRLACGSFVRGAVCVEVFDEKEDGMEITASFSIEEEEVSSAFYTQSAEKNGTKDSCGLVAVDIGTTTMAAALLDRKSGRVLRYVTSVNHQRNYGADVISRIHASVEGHRIQLQDSVKKDLSNLNKKLGLSGKDVFMVISANTTMEHLLQGYPCDSLGVAPYIPYDISLHKYENMLILPGISTYVGADIVSGIVACGMDQKEEVSILIDLGTNGEMVIGNHKKIMVASTAAGPAFEGGNISCGVPGIPGAISSVVIGNHGVRYETIGKKEPIGLCGSGVLDIIYELLNQKKIDKTGLLCEEYFETGYPITEKIRFTQKDVREVQLAKAAVRAGIDILMKEYGVCCDEISSVYLAGGFGQKISIKKAIGIGILPERLEKKIQAVGNSSLAGAVLFANHPEVAERYRKVSVESVEITLASHRDFYDRYVDSMSFK